MDQSSPQQALLLENVDLSLGTGAARVHILKSISLAITQGESVGLVGPSGSGKSTLLMCMAGLERPDQGQIKILGQSITQMNEDRLATFRGRHIGVVFQSFHLIPTMTALENIAVPLELVGDAQAFERARHLLDRVGLSDRADHYPAELSGGEQQRIALARAIIANPEILVADEPTGNLDDSTGQSIIDLLFSLQREHGTTLILVTHDLDLAGRCDRIIRLRSGAVEPASAVRPL